MSASHYCPNCHETVMVFDPEMGIWCPVCGVELKQIKFDNLKKAREQRGYIDVEQPKNPN